MIEYFDDKEGHKAYKRMVKRLEKLSTELVEKRSDIAEIIDDILDDRNFSKKDIEKRIAEFTFDPKDVESDKKGNITVYYDTLTTLLGYDSADGEGKDVDGKYYD